MSREELEALDEAAASGEWIPFDGFDYRAVRCSDGTYDIINEEGDTMASGVLLLGDSPYNDMLSAIVNATEA